MLRDFCVVCSNIRVIQKQQGEHNALAYARQTTKAYRKAILKTPGLIARPMMIRAYKCAKRFIGGR